MREILIAWKESCGRIGTRRSRPSQKWLKLLDIKIALMDYNLQTIQPLLQTMIKQDDIAYYTGLAKRAGKVETEDGMHGLWKELRATLPKWKTRRTQQRHDIDDALCNHFSSLEAGTTVSFRELYQKCVDYQNQSLDSAPQCLYLSDLPSLFEIEQVCRRTTPTRAPGPDLITPEVCRYGVAGIAPHVHNMIWKICCEQAEPIWFKGGYVHPIYKQKGAFDDPTAYRGVVLLDVYGKKFHAWLRRRLVPVLQSRKTAGQLGGLPCEQTLTGSHLLRVHGQVARSLRLSSAVVFVDVKAAFHHMLRELIFLQGDPAFDPNQVLDSNHFKLQELQALILQRCQEHPDDFPSSIRKLADDVHRHTWFTQRGAALQPSEVVYTLRGTRPGSPVADVGFNLLMSDILQDLQQRIDTDEIIMAHTAEFPVQIPPITWVDDLAIPLSATHPSMLTQVLQVVLQHVHEVFYSRGLQINYDKGKTEVVVMFRGEAADEARRCFFSSERETYIVASTTTHVLSVRAVPSYKHLGIRYQMDSDLHHEIQCRSAQARTAFHEVKRQIFANRALTTSTRIQLLHSLVFSKLLYGSGGWYEIPRRMVTRIDSILMRFYRSIVNEGFWKDQLVTDEALRADYNLPTFRYLLAVARLRFLRHVATHTHDYHRQLLLAERATDKGWLFEVEDDLDWLRSCLNLTSLPATPTTTAAWKDFFLWLREAQPPWKSWLKRATKMHFLRENIAHECRSFHKQAQKIMEKHGAAFHTPVIETEGGRNHACPECNAVFNTSTGMAVHRAKKHGVHSPLRDYVQSATCAGCLKFMWTTARVVQHLRYRPNRCFDRIFASCTPHGYEPVELPDHLQKVKRLPAVRHKHGPLLPLPREKERVHLRRRLQECEAHGARLDYWSKVNPTIQQMANLKFKEAAEKWLRTEPDHEEGLYVTLLETMAKLPLSELLSEKCLIGWIENYMWDDCVDWPVNALQALEREHQQILKNLSIWILRSERDHLAHILQSITEQQDLDRIQHVRIPHPKKQKRAQPVPMHYVEMEQDELLRHDVTVTAKPAICSTSWRRSMPDATYYVVHLYSGRRRQEDLQWHLERLLADHPGHIQVLSVDTAVHHTCDVNQATNWEHFWKLADSGFLLSIVLGPPCETWSAARNEPLLDEEGRAIAGPRPLRSTSRPWGLDSLTPREYRQLQIGMRLLLRGLILSILTVVNGGSALLEHPADSNKEGRPSVWRTGLVKLLIDSGLFCKYTFAQYRYGSPGVKPTTFLYGGLPRLPRVMKCHENHQAVKPLVPLIGRTTSGAFNTSAAKEYPGPLCQAMAACIMDQINAPLSPHAAVTPERLSPCIGAFLNLLHTACSNIDEGRSYLPDYQGR